MNYRDLLTEEEILEVRNGDRTEAITDVAYDSRRVGPGAMFVAIFGFATDGHRFVEAAIEQGAAVISS